MSMQSEGRRQNAECGIGENPDSGIRDKGLGRRGLRLLSRNCEIRRIPESESEVTARREPRPIGRAKLLLSRIQPPAAVATGQLSWADKVGGPVARIFHYRFKFLTVRNLISPSAARTYDYVSVNSLQCGNRGHGPASPRPLSSEWSAWSCLPAGRPYAGKVTARQEPRPTGLGHLSHIGSPVRLFRCHFHHSIHSTTTYYIKLVQISHGEKFGERKDIMSHKGKIARLPLAIREQLNRRLQDGEIGRDLVVWLNSVPEVQAVLKAEFGERPVNEPNLSDWKAGGYEDWLVHPDTMERVNQLVANAKELGGASQTPLSELLMTCLAARYVVELGRLTGPRTPREGTRPTAEAEGEGGCDLEGRDSRRKAAFPDREAEGNGGCDLERLRKICRDVLALRRLDLAAQRLRIEREAADREMRKEEEERKEKLLKAEQNRRMVQSGRQALRAAGHHLPYDPSIDDEAQMQKEVAVADLRRVRDKLAALQARLLKDMERQEKYDQEMEEFEQAEEEKLAREADTAKEGEKLAGESEAAGAAAEGQPVGAQGEQVGGAQSSPLRKKRSKAEAKGAGEKMVAVAPEVAAQDDSGQSNKGELRKIKATKGKLGMPKAESMSKSLAKELRDAKILAGMLKEGE